MENKDISALYEVPQITIIELSLGSGAICAASNEDQLVEDEGEW